MMGLRIVLDAHYLCVTRRLGVFKPWRKCSVLLSVASGELFVHRKSRSPPQVFPLSRFTGASIRSMGRHTFTVRARSSQMLWWQLLSRG